MALFPVLPNVISMWDKNNARGVIRLVTIYFLCVLCVTVVYNSIITFRGEWQLRLLFHLIGHSYYFPQKCLSHLLSIFILFYIYLFCIFIFILLLLGPA